VAQEAGSHQIGDWVSLGGSLERGAAVTSWGDGGECELFAIHDDGERRDRIDVFALDRDGRLAHRWWDGTRWVTWEVVRGAPLGDSVSCTWSGERLDVFVSRHGGALWYNALR
jgi:Repeat of unknown function (DUF346)